jgi:hypothetical protein
MARRDVFAPRDGRLWHVDWFGAVVVQPGSSAEPTINVLISQVDENRLARAAQARPAKIAAKDSKQRLTVMGIGRLVEVSIGSFWRNDEPQNIAPYDRLQATVSFSTETTEITNASQVSIPSDAIVLGRGLGAPCLTTTVGTDTRLVIPCVEVLRFYFASSTHMVTSLVGSSFDVAIEQMITRERCGLLEDGSLRIWLKSQSFDEDPGRLALLYLSEPARIAARRIHESLVRREWLAQEDSMVMVAPEVWPPVTGPVRLDLDGIWLDRPRRFLAFRIRRGTLWPRDLAIPRIAFGRDNDGREAPSDDANRPDVGYDQARPPEVHGAKPVVLPAADPTKRVAAQQWRTAGDDPEWSGYPPIDKLEKGDVRCKARAMPYESAIRDVSTGPTSNSAFAETRPVRIALDSPAGRPPPASAWVGFDSFLRALGALRRRCSCTTRTIPAGRYGCGTNAAGAVLSRLPRRGRVTRERYAMVAAIEWEGRWFAAFELDRGAQGQQASLALAYRLDLSPMTGEQLERALEICADHGGVWFGRGEAIPLVEHRWLPHAGGSHCEESMARRLAAYIAGASARHGA